MLFMLPSKMKDIPFDRVYPFNENFLFLAVSENLAFALMDIKNDKGATFSIKGIMENEKNLNVFGKEPFRERVEKFSKTIHSRLERFFITKKDDYLFFDKVEQEKLISLFEQHALTARVEVYEITDRQFHKIDFDEISLVKFSTLKVPLRLLGAVFVSPPEHFMGMLIRCKEYDKTLKSKKHSVNRIDPKAAKILNKYSELKKVSTLSEFNAFYRIKSKELHPDLHPDKVEDFKEFQQDMVLLKKSKWFKSIK